MIASQDFLQIEDCVNKLVDDVAFNRILKWRWNNIETLLKNGPLNKGEQQGCFSVNSMRLNGLVRASCAHVTTIREVNREWIGIDITNLAISVIEKRLSDAFPDG